MDPLASLLEVLRLENTHYTLVGVWRDSAVVRAEPFDALELELERETLWER